jgi:hypothetical protein
VLQQVFTHRSLDENHDVRACSMLFLYMLSSMVRARAYVRVHRFNAAAVLPLAWVSTRPSFVRKIDRSVCAESVHAMMHALSLDCRRPSARTYRSSWGA